MSSINKTTVECPNCKEKSEFIFWDSINTEINPELKKEILSGNLFNFRCNNCSEQTRIEYSVLYHDPIGKNLLYLITDYDGANKTIRDLKKQVKIFNYPRNRILKNSNNLIEKIIIFDFNLSDFIIERIKIDIYAQMKEKEPSVKLENIYFNNVTEESISFIVLIDENEIQISVSRDYYVSLEDNIDSFNGDELVCLDYDFVLNYKK